MESAAQRMAIKYSVRNNVPMGSGLLRSGESIRGGFAVPPEVVSGALTAGVPLVGDLLKRPFKALISNPVNKLWDWLGLGAGAGAARTMGKFWHRPGDIGLPVYPGHAATNATMSEHFGPQLSHRDHKNLRVLEHKLQHLAHDPDAFMRKLHKIHAKGEAWFKKHRKILKGERALSKKHGVKKYHHSKRYHKLKLAYYAKHGCGTRYYKSDKYKKHKAAYYDHHTAKKKH